MAEMNSTEIALMDRLKNREAGAISQLYDQYAPALYGAIFRIVKSHAAAEMILEQTFLRIIQDIDTIKSSSTLFSTLYSIARSNACQNVLTNALNKMELQLNSDEQVYAVSNLELLDGMESQCGEVIRHLYLEGHSLTQTSQALNMSTDKVKTQLRSGLAYIHGKINGSQKIALATVIIISQLIQY